MYNGDYATDWAITPQRSLHLLVKMLEVYTDKKKNFFEAWTDLDTHCGKKNDFLK